MHAEVVPILLPLKVIPYTNARLKGVFGVSQLNCRVLPPGKQAKRVSKKGRKERGSVPHRNILAHQ